MYKIDILRIIFLITIAWAGSIIYRIEIAQTLTDEKWETIKKFRRFPKLVKVLNQLALLALLPIVASYVIFNNDVQFIRTTILWGGVYTLILVIGLYQEKSSPKYKLMNMLIIMLLIYLILMGYILKIMFK
ncbi:hypothetical protein [Veillonella sp. AS16]|uniref:hypothetical protein n=1 Tax=Veillonella sp. AS16 TaxID=936589 RepID=UPI00057156BE|nr:hypothetical protein [Veillonella sp. AS16]